MTLRKVKAIQMKVTKNLLSPDEYGLDGQTLTQSNATKTKAREVKANKSSQGDFDDDGTIKTLIITKVKSNKQTLKNSSW